MTHVFNSFPAGGNFCRLLIVFANRLVLVWILTVWYSDSVPERIFWNSWFWKVSRRQPKHEKTTQHAKSFELKNWWWWGWLILRSMYINRGYLPNLIYFWTTPSDNTTNEIIWYAHFMRLWTTRNWGATYTWKLHWWVAGCCWNWIEWNITIVMWSKFLIWPT